MSYPPPNAFLPFVYPKPNSLIQAGTPIVIKDLKSEAGKLLNGKTGVALKYSTDISGELRWVVALDDEDATKEKVQKSIKGKNLVMDGTVEMQTCFVTDPKQGGGGQGPALVSAGTMNGTLTICVWDDPKRPGFDVETAKAQFELIGAPVGFIEMLQTNLPAY